MAQDITIAGASYEDAPWIDVPLTNPDTPGETARFMDTSDANAAAGDILQGKTAYVNGVKLTGTNPGTGETYSITPGTQTWQHNTYVTIGLDIAEDGTLTVYKASGSGTANNMKVVYPQSDTFNAANVITKIDIPYEEGTHTMPITVWWDNQSGQNTDHNNHTISFTVVKSGGGGSLPVTTNLLKGDGEGGAVAATPGEDYLTEAAFMFDVEWDGSQWSVPVGTYDAIYDAVDANIPVYAKAGSEYVPLADLSEGPTFEMFLFWNGKLTQFFLYIQSDSDVTYEQRVVGLSRLSDDSDHRTVTDAQISEWNAKQAALTPGDGLSIVNNVISLDLDNYDGGAF